MPLFCGGQKQVLWEYDENMAVKDWIVNLPRNFKSWHARKKQEKLFEDKEKMDKSHSKVLIVLTVIFSLYALTLVFPLVWLLMNSVKTKQEFLNNPWPLAESIKISNYAQVFKIFDFGSMLFNSLSLALTIPTVALFVTACVAYAVAKYRFPGRKLLYFVAVAIMFIPTTGSLPVKFRLANDLLLYDNLPGMIIMSAGGFGFNFLILHGIFTGISKTYSEAAKIDGAGNWRIFLQIMMPQARATMFAVWILGFIGIWNDYATSRLFYPGHETLSVGLVRISDGLTTGSLPLDYPVFFAAVIITVIPILLLFILCQKYIMRLNMGGGIKE